MASVIMMNCSAILKELKPNQIGSRLRAVHVAGVLSVETGGPSYSVPRLCEALATAGVDATLLSVTKSGIESDKFKSALRAKPYDDLRFPRNLSNLPVLGALHLSFGLARAIRVEASSSNIVHNHGLWLMPNLEAGWAAARANKPLVVTPRGMLGAASLAFSSQKKRIFWRFFQGPALRDAACFHATSEQEYQEIRDYGIRAPVAIIPNGIDLPPIRPDAGNSIGRLVLSLGRIHPKKGLDRLLRAWAKVERDNPAWRLRIVGPAELGHDDELRALAVKLNLRRVAIEPPIFNDNKHVVFQEADVFVLSSLNENFGLTVAESLAAGTPVISTKGAPWPGLEIERCGWWIDHGAAPLAQTLNTAMSLPREALLDMGARGRAWMARDFGWDAIGQKMAALYSWLARGSDRPSFVHLD
jgi:glycosyltransferase involved in cell wall biosynthesis